MIRWFTDLPIERKLRVVILVPAFAVFAVAMVAHVAMNLLHLRDDLLWSAARVARVTGTATIEALRAGDDAAALKAMDGLRDEWLVSDAEVLAPDGRALAVYLRGENGARLESAAAATPGHCACGAARRSSAPAALCAGRPIPHHRGRRAQGSGRGIHPHHSCRSTVMYPDWPRLPAHHPGSNRGRRADRILARRAAAAANLRAHRQPGAYHAAGVFRGRLQPARRAQLSG